MTEIKNDQFHDKLDNFLLAFGATRKLLKQAHIGGFFIEGIVLYASLIDGLLRIALILHDQLENRNDNIDEMMISQDQKGSYFTEREIMRFAIKEKIISEEIYKELNYLYDRRNEIVHRYFLTNITYNNLSNYLGRYEFTYKNLYDIVYDLEQKQMEKGIGMTVAGAKMTHKDKAQLSEDIGKKIG